MDIGEQDDRWSYSYSREGVLGKGGGAYFPQYLRFRDFTDLMEHDSGGTMASLGKIVALV